MTLDKFGERGFVPGADVGFDQFAVGHVYRLWRWLYAGMGRLTGKYGNAAVGDGALGSFRNGEERQILAFLCFWSGNRVLCWVGLGSFRGCSLRYGARRIVPLGLFSIFSVMN